MADKPTNTTTSQPTNTEVNSETVAEETNKETLEADSSEETTEENTSVKEPKKEEKVLTKKLKKLKLKVDGKELEEELPFEVDESPEVLEYLQKQLQLAKAAQKRMNQYAELEKEVGSFIDELKKNPRKILSDPNIGVDIKALAAQVIEEEIENSKKSPEQLEKEKLEARLKELEDERKKEKDEWQHKELERLQAQEYERYDFLIDQALEKSELPKTPYVIKKIADYMLMGINDGLDVKPEDVLPLVKDEMQNDLKQMFAVMPDEVIENIIGKDVITRLRKKTVAKAKADVLPKKPLDVAQPKEEKTTKDKSKKTYRDFFGV